MEDTGNTDRRIAEFRRNLLNFEQMSQQNRTSDPDSGYRTSTPEPAAFIADPDSPHLAPSPHLHPNITTRTHTRNRTHRRLSDLFSLSHRGRHNQTPTFDQDRRPKISRPIVDQGEIAVPNNGPYIYNHPSRPRLDVEIPRSSFSDLWGQRYGPIGEGGYNVDAQSEIRNTQSVDFGHLVGARDNQNRATRRYGVSLGGIADWHVDGRSFVPTASTSGSTEGFESEGRDADADTGENYDDMNASYPMPLVSPSPPSSSSPSMASASLPSLSNLPPLPPSTVVLPEEQPPPPSSLRRELSERWTRHPLRQNPPNVPYPPPAPPSSPIHFPSSPPAIPVWARQHQHQPSLEFFRPACGVIMAGVGDTAMIQPFLVAADDEEEEDEEEEEEEEEDEGSFDIREDTPVPRVDTRPFEQQSHLQESASAQSRSHAASQLQPQPRQHRSRSRGSRSGVRSFCCGLFTRRRARPDTSPPTSSFTPTQTSSTLTQPSTLGSHLPLQAASVVTHTAIPGQDEIQNQEEQNDQENQPPGIIESLAERGGPDDRHVNDYNGGYLDPVDVNERDYLYNNDRGNGHDMEGEADGVDRRPSVRHSWVTVSRWFE